MSLALGPRLNTYVFKHSGKLKPTTVWISAAEKLFSVFQAMCFYLSFSPRHNRMKRKYTSSPRKTNKRENITNVAAFTQAAAKTAHPKGQWLSGEST